MTEAQLSLLDELPADVERPASGKPALVYGEHNRQNGHLLITTGPPRTRQDWLFENTGARRLRCCLPGWDTGRDTRPPPFVRQRATERVAMTMCEEPRGSNDILDRARGSAGRAGQGFRPV